MEYTVRNKLITKFYLAIAMSSLIWIYKPLWMAQDSLLRHWNDWPLDNSSHPLNIQQRWQKCSQPFLNPFIIDKLLVWLPSLLFLGNLPIRLLLLFNAISTILAAVPQDRSCHLSFTSKQYYRCCVIRRYQVGEILFHLPGDYRSSLYKLLFLKTAPAVGLASQLFLANDCLM